MVRKVYCYPIPDKSSFTISMPSGAEILGIYPQNGEIILRALADPMRMDEDRKFRMAQTGNALHEDDALRYIGTMQLNSVKYGDLFEIVKK